MLRVHPAAPGQEVALQELPPSTPHHPHDRGRAGAPDDPGHLGWDLIANQLGFVLRAPGRHKALAASVLAACVALSLVLIAVMPFRYRVQAVVLTQRNSLMSSLTNPGVNRDWDAPTRSAREVVIRREKLTALCKQIRFPERYLLARPPIVRARDWVFSLLSRTQRTQDDVLVALVDTLQERLQIYAGAEGTVTISFEWSNREIALDVVQAALQIFLEERHVAEVEAVGDAIAIFESHDAKIQKQIAAKVAQVEEKERALQIRSGPRLAPRLLVRPGDGEELGRLDATLAARRRALADLEIFRQQRLAEMQAQLAQQQSIYASSHPTLASTKLAIEGLMQPSPQSQVLQAEIKELEAEVSRRGGNAAPTATPASAALEGDMAEARLRLLQMSDPRLGLERRQLEDLVREHSSLLERMDAARLEMDTALAAFKYRYSVVTPPQLPKTTHRPYVLLYLAGGLLGGLFLAFAAATAADLRAGRVLERWQVEQALDLQVLGELPQLPEAPRAPRLAKE